MVNKEVPKEELDKEPKTNNPEYIKYQKTLQTGINLLKNNPNAIIDILQTATRLSYLRGRLFEQEKKEEMENE